AAFGTWDVFADIFNRSRTKRVIRAGWEVPPKPRSPRVTLLDELYRSTMRLWGDLAYDSFMQADVIDYLYTSHPRLLFVGYGETDEWAHAGRYDQVLHSAHRFDGFVAQLWRALQSDGEYRDRTTLIITTDHGRGSGPTEWKSHGR